jgi:hypothetical protein
MFRLYIEEKIRSSITKIYGVSMATLLIVSFRVRH